MSEHARLSPSDKCWPYCPGSVREQAKYPNISGEAAIDGTGSHLLLEMCLKNQVRAEAYIGHQIGVDHFEKPNGWTVDQERADRVQQCLDYLSRRVRELRELFPGATIKVEAESKSYPGLLIGREDWWGTCDITITITNELDQCLYIEIIDYKDGRGWVGAQDNTQLSSYLFGKMREFIGSGPQLVRPFHPELVPETRQTIVQPKTNPTVRYIDLDGPQAFASFDALANAARQTDYEDAPLIPDDKGGKGHCLWCRHKPNCIALRDSILNKVNDMTQDLTLTGGVFELIGNSAERIKSMDDDQLTTLFDAQPGIMQIFQDIQDELERRVMENGVNGFAMQPGNSSRVWAKPEEEIEKALKAKRLTMTDIYPPKLISPAQAVKHPKLTKSQRKNLEEELIVTKVGANKLTRVKYEPEKLTAAEMFGGVVEEVKPLGKEDVDLDWGAVVDPAEIDWGTVE